MTSKEICGRVGRVQLLVNEDVRDEIEKLLKTNPSLRTFQYNYSPQAELLKCFSPNTMVQEGTIMELLNRIIHNRAYIPFQSLTVHMWKKLAVYKQFLDCIDINSCWTLAFGPSYSFLEAVIDHCPWIEYLLSKVHPGTLKKGCDLCRDNILHIAIKKDLHVTALQLIQNGVPVDERNAHGMTSLQLAVERNMTCIIHCLIQYGANVEVLDRCGRTPLVYSVRQNMETMVQCLLANGANVEAADGERGWLPIHIACDLGYPEILVLLGKYNARLDRETPAGDSPAHLVCKKSSCADEKSPMFQCMKYLNEQNVDFDVPNMKGLYPIHVLSRFGSGFVLNYAAESIRSINWNRTDKSQGKLPAHVLFHHQSMRTIMELHQKGKVNLMELDNHGHYPHEYITNLRDAKEWITYLTKNNTCV